MVEFGDDAAAKVIDILRLGGAHGFLDTASLSVVEIVSSGTAVDLSKSIFRIVGVSVAAVIGQISRSVVLIGGAEETIVGICRLVKGVAGTRSDGWSVRLPHGSIVQHIFGAPKGTFQVDHPVLSKQRPQPGGKDLGLSEDLCSAFPTPEKRMKLSALEFEAEAELDPTAAACTIRRYELAGDYAKVLQAAG